MKIFLRMLLGVLSICFIALSVPRLATADISRENEVKATVGEFYLSLYGFASQNASIVLKSNNTLLSFSLADDKGAFSFVKIPINKGFSSFCLQTTDVKRLGSSEGCMQIPPASADVTLRSIYLPPTIGLERSAIQVGSSALSYGYTMPNADVNISISGSTTVDIKSDQTGRYSYTLGNLQVGSYNLSSKGQYQGRQSLAPNSKVTLKVLTSSIAFINEAPGLRRALLRLLPWIILLIFSITLVALYLIHRFRPQWLLFISKSRLYIFFTRRRRLHHHWFVGY